MCVRASVRVFVCLFVCLFVNAWMDGCVSLLVFIHGRTLTESCRFLSNVQDQVSLKIDRSFEYAVHFAGK